LFCVIYFAASSGEAERLEVWVAAAGARNVAEDMTPPSTWPVIVLSMLKTEEVIVGGCSQKAYRVQFPIAPFGTMTIHKALGQTCPRLVTRISGKANDKYNIW
jgi:hypothetical protein